MEEKDVVDLYLKVKFNGIKIWIDGGWAVDALLGEHTRAHKDLDIIIQEKDISAFRNFLSEQGYKEIKLNIAQPHNFVLGDKYNREIDVHVISLNDQGDGLYGRLEDGQIYPAASLTGKGKIDNIEVDCISPEYLVKFHSGYTLGEKDYQDVIAICKKFDLEIPIDFSQFR
jgi:lincosamide nucleotidyltransferase A/C/D/E